MGKKRVVVICPGRGSYTKETLGYLQRRGVKISTEQIQMDHARKQLELPTLTELDTASAFKTQLHTKGEHASPLIYACSLADFVNIDR
ncbi:MAG: hypothetical protein KDD22_00310, partial [Bdellovibrionales bacterium]|nr:hypothetical protein [Bdellovibrionales bacterium]